ncbi:MAG: MATE family efflux transporter [Alphaproteobacteria bacterium]
MGLFEYSEENIKISSSIIQILGISLPFVSISIVTQFFLQGIKKAWISSWFVLVANIINISLCWLLIKGNLGFPELGAIGVAISTTSVRIFLGLGTVAYIFLNKKYKIFFEKKDVQHQEVTKLQKKLGIAATSNLLSVESSNLFSVFFISVINVTIVAAYTLSYRVFIIGSLISVSFAVSCSILMSSGIAHKDISKIKKIILSCLRINNIFMFIICILIFALAPQIANILAKEETLAAQTTPFLRIISFLLFFNGLYIILIICLRALHDLLIPSIITFLLFAVYVPMFSVFFASEAIQVTYFLLSANIIVSAALMSRLLYLFPRYKF